VQLPRNGPVGRARAIRLAEQPLTSLETQIDDLRWLDRGPIGGLDDVVVDDRDAADLAAVPQSGDDDPVIASRLGLSPKGFGQMLG
jgi:hypothetical protein